MVEEQQQQNPISVVDILKQSWRLYRENILLIASIAAIGEALVLSGALLTLVSKTAGTWFGFLTGLPAMFISIWAAIALVIAIASRYEGKEIAIKAAFRGTKRKYWRFVGIFILYLLVLGTGFLLLVVPGLYWGTIFSLAPIVVVLESRKDIGPFRLSKKLIRGSFWRVFLLGLVTAVLINMPFLLIWQIMKANQQLTALFTHVSVIAFMPLVTAVQVTLYYHLKERKQAELMPAEGAVAPRGKGLGCLSAIGLLILIIVLSSFWISRVTSFVGKERIVQILQDTTRSWGTSPVEFPAEFPGGVNLESPGEWDVRGTAAEKEIYNFEKSGSRAIGGFALWFIPVQDLKLAAPHPSVDDPIVGSKLMEAMYGGFMVGMIEKMYDAQPVKVVTIGNRSWGEYTLESSTERRYGTRTEIWKTLYTFAGDYLVAAGYKYVLNEIVDEARAERDNVDLEREELKRESLPNEEKAIYDTLILLEFAGDGG